MKNKFLKIILALSISAIMFGCSSKNVANEPGEMMETTPNAPFQDSPTTPPEEGTTTPADPSSDESLNPSTSSPKIVEQTPGPVKTPDPVPAPAPKTQAPAPAPQQKPTTPPVTESGGNYLSQVEQEIFRMVNEERQKAGVPQLSYNKTMEKYARIKSKDMGDRNYFAHENPEGELITAQMKRDGVTYNAWGENIAYTGGSGASGAAAQFMNMWMNSDGHRKNILSTNFTGIGVGVSSHGNKIYATQEFYR